MTQNWNGIRVSAVLAIAASAATLLAGVLILFVTLFDTSPVDEAESPIPLKPMMFVMAGLCLAFSAWGTSTGIAILLRRRWARISILVFAGLLAFLGAGSMLIMLFVLLLAAIQSKPIDMVGWAAAALYAAATALGVWWLVLFNRSRSKEYFAAHGPVGEHARPLSVSVIAWCLLVGAAFMAIGAAFGSPAMLFGTILTGWLALVVYGAFAAVQMYLGRGLLHLEGKARIGAITYLCFAAGNATVSLMRHGYAEMTRQMQIAIPRYLPAGGPIAMPGPMWLFALSTTLFYAVAVYYLVRRRPAFH